MLIVFQYENISNHSFYLLHTITDLKMIFWTLAIF